MLASLVGLAAIAVVGLNFHERGRVRRALEAIRACGQPVMPVDLPLTPLTRPSRFAESAARFKEVERSVYHSTAFDENEIDTFLAGPNSSRAADETLTALRELRACLGEAKGEGEDLGTYTWQEMNRSPAPGEAPSRCFALAHKTRRMALEPTIPAALELCDGDPIDVLGLVEECSKVEFREAPYPASAAVQNVIAVRNLASTAIDLTIENRIEEALLRLSGAFEGARKIESIPWIAGFTAWEAAQLQALEGLTAILPRLPPGMDLGDLEKFLDPAKPRQSLIVALEGDRTFANRGFEGMSGLYVTSIQRGNPSALVGFLRGTVILRHDQANYLTAMSTAIEAADKPFREAMPAWKAGFQRLESQAWWTQLTVMYLPQVEVLLTRCAEHEARIQLAHAALIAYRDGAEAGARVASLFQDPFSDSSLHARIDPGDMLTLWSVGEDGIDDGAPIENSAAHARKDLVVRLKTR